MVGKKDKPLNKAAPRPSARRKDPESRTGYDALLTSLRGKRPTDYRVGKITEDDKYDDDTS